MKNKTYELLYDTQAQFNQAQGSSGNVTSVTPGVAYVVEYIKPACFVKIYVGDGSSQAHDQEVLNAYLQDSTWAAYSNKLDLWYNYHGEYRQE